MPSPMRTIAQASPSLVFFASAAIFAADTPSRYPVAAPIAQYFIESRDAEIALARTAAPASISADAEILVMTKEGYETAVKGKNGFVCMVQRSWNAPFNDPEFWNPKNRSPVCLNAAAARTVLLHDKEHTAWALSGMTREAMVARMKAKIAANDYVMPEPGAMSYMMSPQQYLNDAGLHWRPHVMFYIARAAAADWGADLPGSPIFAGPLDPEPVTIFFVPVDKWSDGTAAPMAAH